MVTFGEVYAAVITVLLLVALAVAIPVLKRIVVDGIERRRKWKTGEMERYTEDPEFDRGPPAALDGDAETGPGVTCTQCGTANEAGFTYCENCLGRL
ncbi:MULTISPECIES: DUF7577 domain-containing protein [Salinibaculum]|uniref:DUF7577 domain-containing protein n=1 Tax=Salinibaculum TaxID=2732368 RepID=UPI0030CF463D